MLVFSILAILITGGLVNLIIFKVQQSKSPSNLSIPDNPLLLTIEAMEAELAELHENNIHMKRIAQLEKDIEEANKHAEALSKVAGNYGNTIEEVGESIVGGIGGRNVVHTVTPRQNTAIFRTYTSQTGWSSYYDVKLK